MKQENGSSSNVQVYIWAESLGRNSWCMDWAVMLKQYLPKLNSGIFKNIHPGGLRFHRLSNHIVMILLFIGEYITSYIRRKSTIHIINSSPAGLIFLCAFCKPKNSRLWFLIYDLYPDVLYSQVPKLLWAKPILDKFFRMAFRRADYIICIDDLMSERIIERRLCLDRRKLVVIPLLSDGIRSRAKSPTVVASVPQIIENVRRNKQLNLVMSGHFTSIHYRDELIDELIKFTDLISNEIRINIFVTGNSNKTMKYVNGMQGRAKGRNIFWSWKGFLKESEFLELQRSADFSLVTLRDECSGLCFPSKLVDNVNNQVRSLFLGPVGQTLRSLSDSQWIITGEHELLAPKGGVRPTKSNYVSLIENMLTETTKST